MIALTAAFFCLVGLPRSEAKVSLKMPLATLADVTQEIRKQTGLAFKFDLMMKPADIKVTVLVRDMKAEDLLEEIADVLSLNVTVAEGTAKISYSPGARGACEAYLLAEDKLLAKEAEARLNALVAALPTVFDPPPAAEGEPDVSDLKSWARRKIRLPGPYAAALARSATPDKTRIGVGLVTHGSYPVIDGTPVYGYAFKRPRTPRGAAAGHCSLDSYSAKFENTQVLIRYCPESGSWLIGQVAGESGQIDDYPKLIRYPRPPKALQDQPFALNLAAWQKGDPESEVGKLKVADEPNDPELLFPNHPTLTDHLNWLYENAKANIVADAYRFPSGLKVARPEGRTVQACMDFLSGKTNCFFNISKRCVKVRTAGYWRLARSEPSESSVQTIEAAAKKRDLTLDDYADFATSMSAPAYERFEGPDRFLSTIDLRPLMRGTPILACYGKFNAAQRRALWNGQVYDWMNTTQRGGIDTSAVSATAAWACFGDVDVMGRYADVLECPALPEFYLTADNRTEDADQIENVKIFTARYFRLLSPENGPSGNVGIFLGSTGRDGVVYWFKN